MKTTSRKLAMYQDALNDVTVFLEQPVYGYYRISEIQDVTFNLLDEEKTIQQQNEILKEDIKQLKKALRRFQGPGSL